MEKMIAIVILIVVVVFAGATTIIYAGSRVQEWIGVFKKAMAEVEAENANKVQEESPKAKEPIILSWVKKHVTVPVLLLVAFIAEYIAVSTMLGAKSVEFLFLFVFAMLAMVVLETKAIDKKAPQMQFGLRLAVTILFEICFVMDVYLFVSGYYFGDGLRLKRIAGAIGGIVLFFVEAYRTQHSWYDMQDAKKVRESEET